MSGLLEADIDLGLESGAAAFDPLYCSPPTHARTHTLTHTYYPPEQTEQLLYHRAYSTPPTSRGLCALTSLKVHVRFICLTFSPPLPPSLRGSTALSNPTAIRFFHSPSSRRFTHGSLARPTREQPCSSPLNSRDLDAACPSRSRRLFTPFPDHAPFHLFLRYSRRTGTTLLVVNVLVLFHAILHDLDWNRGRVRSNSFSFLR